jgi:esterase/lipase
MARHLQSSQPTRRWPRALALAVAVLCVGCAAPRGPMVPLGQGSFAQYRTETQDWMAQHRAFQSDERDSELARNAPMEWRPAQAARKGVVLFHGLGDSPWSFADIGQALAGQGFLVRTALLPGHGTRPADLIGVDLDDWRRLVAQQAALLAQEVPEVYLGGFSTGANLALEYALDHSEVAGLVLFSPALKSGVPLDWIVPWVARVRTWLRQPDSAQPQQTTLRYLNVPTNGFAQYYRSAAAVREKIARQPYARPALLVLAQHDSVVDVEHVLGTFETRFIHPASRLIWYGDLPAARGATTTQRVLVRTDRLPQQRISQFSHMGVLFSPANPLYGSEGTQRMCWNGQEAADQARCMAGEPVWYSDWGYREPAKVHARLTFNPYFDWQAEVMREVLAAE